MADKPLSKKVLNLAATWKINPVKWVEDWFGKGVDGEIYKAQERAGRIRNGEFVFTGRPATSTGLSYQQEDALRQWGELIESKLRKANGLELTERQSELAGKIGMSIMSSNGNGKDFLAGLVTWHFMSLFRDARGMATANTGRQLHNVYWSEVANIRNLAKKPDPNNPESRNELHTAFEIQTERLFKKMPDRQMEGKRHFLELVTINTKATPEEQGESLAGRHADHMVIIIDEWSGIPDAVFKPLDRTLTGKLNLVFGIFNPTRNSGFAMDTHGKFAEQWLCLHWNAIDSDNVPREQIERLAQYGENSPAYRIGVLGRPPLSDSNSLISYDSIMDAIGRDLDISEFDPVMTAVDAGGGGDRSVVCVREGPVVRSFDERRTTDPDELADWAASVLLRADATVTFVDNIGLGWYLPKALRNRKIDARPADSRNTSQLKEPERFLNKRSEMYWDLKMAFENKAISIPNDPDLINELGAIVQENSGNKVKIGDKKDIRKKLGFSPDKADALAMTYYKADSYFRKNNRKKRTVKMDMSGVFLR